MTFRAAHIPERAGSATGKFEILEMDEHHAKASAFNMLFMTWRLHTHEDAYRRAIRLAEQLASRFSGGIGVFHVVEVEAIPPGPGTRRAFVDFLRLPCVKHFSVAHEGVGFKAASVRAIVAGVHALSRPTCEHSVHKSIELAGAWHAKQQSLLGRQETARQIVENMQALRAAHRK